MFKHPLPDDDTATVCIPALNLDKEELTGLPATDLPFDPRVTAQAHNAALLQLMMQLVLPF